PAASVLARVRMRRSLTKAREALTEVLAQATATDEAQHIVPARLALVEHYWLHDAPESARRQLDALAAMDPANLNPWVEGELHIWAKRMGHELERNGDKRLPVPILAELAGDPDEAAAKWLELQSPYA